MGEAVLKVGDFVRAKEQGVEDEGVSAQASGDDVGRVVANQIVRLGRANDVGNDIQRLSCEVPSQL
jgi:hypothetical protein